MSIALDIRLKKANKTYHEEDILRGVIVINSSAEEKIEGLSVNLDGFVQMQVVRPKLNWFCS